MEEVWKDIEGYEGKYQISNLGNVKSLPKKCGFRQDNGRLLKPFTNHWGYKLFTLSKDNKAKHFSAHILVAKAFIPNPDLKPQVDHINRDRSDNRVENLRWATVSENGSNTVCNVFVQYDGSKLTVSQWARKYKMKYGTLARRLKSGWSIEKALNTPVVTNKR